MEKDNRSTDNSIFCKRISCISLCSLVCLLFIRSKLFIFYCHIQIRIWVYQIYIKINFFSQIWSFAISLCLLQTVSLNGMLNLAPESEPQKVLFGKYVTDKVIYKNKTWIIYCYYLSKTVHFKLFINNSIGHIIRLQNSVCLISSSWFWKQESLLLFLVKVKFFYLANCHASYVLYNMISNSGP